MNCPVCVENGQTSLVTGDPVGKTRVFETASMEYWDEGEKLHVHNPGHSIRRFTCTNGHEFLMTQYDACPSCDYNEGRTELWLSDLEKNTVSKYRFTKEKTWKKVVTFDAG